MHHDQVTDRPASRTPTPLARPRIARLGAVAALTTSLALVLAACGGGSSKPASSATPTTAAAAASGSGTGGPNRAALQAFRDCMTSKGVTVPSAPQRPPGSTDAPGAGGGAGTGAGGGRGFGGGFGGGGLGSVFNSTDKPTQDAVNACKDKLPAGFLQNQQQRQNQLNAFVSCMKDNGVTVNRAPAAPGSTPTTIDRTSPAYTKCSVLLPTRPRGTGGTGGTAGTTPPTSAG